ncbi:putative gustatory receptor 98a [Musca domestica]|uniref:Gustatory receptor n=1 Tax=Musca domestica TaxID=7370 RepID=A0ABM3VCH0_MUSDO|nr:putative gustatory receptor 98a [Musca domestica]
MHICNALPWQFDELNSIDHNGLSCNIICWRLLHQLLVILLVGWLSMLRINHFEDVYYEKTDIFSIGMDAISYGILTAIHLIVYWENTWKALTYVELFKNFETILQKFRLYLKFEVNTTYLFLYVALLYSMLTLNILITFFVIYLRYLKSLNAIRLLLEQYSETILKFKLLEYALFLVIIVTIQRHLNAFAAHYLRTTVLRLRTMPEGKEQTDILNIIGILQDIHNLLVTNVNHIENYFNWSLPMLILRMFTEIVLTSYWMYYITDYELSRLYHLYGYSSIILQLMFLFVICALCSQSEKLDTQLANILHMSRHQRHNPLLNGLLNEMSLQLYHQQIKFTAGGFVDVNYKVFGKFIFATVCYVVILIQFHMSV